MGTVSQARQNAQFLDTGVGEGPAARFGDGLPWVRLPPQQPHRGGQVVQQVRSQPVAEQVDEASEAFMGSWDFWPG